MNVKERDLLSKAAINIKDLYITLSYEFSMNDTVSDEETSLIKRSFGLVAIIEQYLKDTVLEHYEISITDIDDYSIDAESAETDGNRD